MWCDNCCLILPLRHGGMGWAAIIAIYSLAASFFLFSRGNYLFFVYPEWQIYAGISMLVACLSIGSAFALSNKNYVWTNAIKSTWPFLIMISLIRGTIMLIQLQNSKDKISWECQHGGQQWEPGVDTSTRSPTSSGGPGAGFCIAGFSTLFIAFIIGLLVDFACQVYMFFLMWRFLKRLEHNDPTLGSYTAIYYNNNS